MGQQDHEEANFETLDELVAEVMERYQIPGAAVGVLREGQIEAQGYSVISLETNYPTRPDTLFQVGSISKVFTTTLIMHLVEERLLELDTPVGEYLPELRMADAEAQANLTLRRLLSHMGDFDGDQFLNTAAPASCAPVVASSLASRGATELNGVGYGLLFRSSTALVSCECGSVHRMKRTPHKKGTPHVCP